MNPEDRKVMEMAREAMGEAHDASLDDQNHDCRAILKTALAAIEERLQADEKFVPSLCKGVPDPRCNYLSACDQICNKCGRKHEPQLFSNWLQADEKEEPVAWRHNIERTEDGVRVCWGDHDRAMPCQWEHYAALRSREEG